MALAMTARANKHSLLGVVPKEDALDALLPWLPTDEPVDDVSPAALQGAIANIARATRRMASPALQERLPALMPGLRRAFDNREPAVRRAVVLCLVDMWRGVGDAMAQHLANLKPTQQRLVEVYMERASQQQQQRVRWRVNFNTHNDATSTLLFSTVASPSAAADPAGPLGQTRFCTWCVSSINV